MMHRDLLKNYGKFPAKVQKKIFELHRKFEEDSTQSSINLERVTHARDPKVRSARVGDDYRAILIAPDKGDTYLLMHVDHHDEAYQWSYNRLFEAHAELGTFQVINVTEVEQVAEKVASVEDYYKNPDYRLHQLSDDDLFLAGIPKALIPSIRAVQNDYDFEQMADYLPSEVRDILYGYVCGMELDEAIEEMLGSTNEVITKPEGPGDFSGLLQARNNDLVLVEGEEHLKAILGEGIEEWRIFLHPYQRKLAQWNVKGPMKINGAAGTGKTVVLMHRAIWLAGQLENSEEVLVTTFTTNLAVTIQTLIEDISSELSSRIKVINLHKLAYKICKENGGNTQIAQKVDIAKAWGLVFNNQLNETGFTKDFICEEFEEIVDRMGLETLDDYLTIVRKGRQRLVKNQRELLWPYFVAFKEVINKLGQTTYEGVVQQARNLVQQGKLTKYRYILVDELQDFGLESLKLISALAVVNEGKNNSLCVVGDGHQRLYSSTNIPLSHAGINVVGRSCRLKINYRTSEQIRRWSQGILAGISIDDLDGGIEVVTGDHSVFSGQEPEIITLENVYDSFDQIIDWIKRLLQESGSGFGDHEICITPSNPQLIKKLNNAGLDTLELKAGERDHGKGEKGIRYGTKKRIKGLEFKAVVLTLNSNKTELQARFEDYVAATRARERLLVINVEPSW